MLPMVSLKLYSVGKVLGIDESKKDENIILKYLVQKIYLKLLSITKDEFV
jgi:hypothetical protein